MMKITKKYLKHLIKEELDAMQQAPQKVVKTTPVASPTVRDLYFMTDELKGRDEQLRKNIVDLWKKCKNSPVQSAPSDDPGAKVKHISDELLKHPIKIYRTNNPSLCIFMWEYRGGAKMLFTAKTESVKTLLQRQFGD